MIGAYSTVPPGENGMFHSKNGTSHLENKKIYSFWLLIAGVLTGSAPAKLAGMPGIVVPNL